MIADTSILTVPSPTPLLTQNNLLLPNLKEGEGQRKGAEIRVQESLARASLVAQWLGIRLPMQGTWVRALVQEDSHMPQSN